jgi:hypothetical protein
MASMTAQDDGSPLCHRIKWFLLSLVLLVFGVALLILFPPECTGFYPRCPLFTSTGLLCPGCGGTRALAALLHGDFLAAWRDNGLVVALLPFAAGCGVVWIVRGEVRVPRGVWVGLGIVAAVFGICRNL